MKFSCRMNNLPAVHGYGADSAAFSTNNSVAQLENSPQVESDAIKF